MKLCTKYLILLIMALQLGCNARKHQNFIKIKKNRDIVLKTISSPYIVFVLQSRDTIKFSKQDIFDMIDQSVKDEIKRWGYSSNQHLSALADTLKGLRGDTVVHQNLSAVGDMTLSGNLDIWIARELLLAGKAEICEFGKKEKLNKLKYVYTQDILGGEQGAFYSIENKLLYWSAISFGE